MADNKFWTERFVAATGSYQCPWCERDLKPKLSNSAANPGKTFVSCAKDFGGCGLFCFLQNLPNEKFNPNKSAGVKRARDDGASPRAGGSNIVGPIVMAPDVVEVRLADLAAKIDRLCSEMAEVKGYIKEVNDQ